MDNKKQLTNDIKRAKTKLKVFEEKGFTQVVADVVTDLAGDGTYPIDKIVDSVNKTRATYEKEIEDLQSQQNKFTQGKLL
jgi:hypothetical protein